MSHITCPKCGGNEHVTGYGFAAGPLGGYTICDCGVVLELFPDTEGLDDEHIARINGYVAEWRAEVWPDATPTSQPNSGKE